MDPWDGSVLDKPDDPRWPAIRRAMGDAGRYARRVDLAGMAPASGIASTSYCLAAPGREYLVYLPEGGTVTVDLKEARGELAVEWFDAAARKAVEGGSTPGGAPRELKAPFDGPAVLYLKAKAAAIGAAGEWIPLFNGKDLEGWTPKITGRELGDNWRDTFRVEDGILKVAYDRYPEFGGHFGHLFYKEKLSHYRLRVEYRFTGQQAPGGPGWAFRNSGAMLHCQPPETMTRD